MCTAFLIAPGLVIQCQNVLAPENLHAKQIGSSKQEKGPSFSLPWNGLPVFVPLGLRLAYGWGCGSSWCFENWKLNGSLSLVEWDPRLRIRKQEPSGKLFTPYLLLQNDAFPTPLPHPVPRTKGMALRSYLMGKESLLASWVPSTKGMRWPSLQGQAGTTGISWCCSGISAIYLLPRTTDAFSFSVTAQEIEGVGLSTSRDVCHCPLRPLVSSLKHLKYDGTSKALGPQCHLSFV